MKVYAEKTAIFAGLTVLAVVAFFNRTKILENEKTKTPREVSAQELEKTVTHKNGSGFKGTSLESRDFDKEYENAKELQSLAWKAGILRSPLTQKGGKLELTLSVRGEKRCEVGDADAMKLDLDNSSLKLFLSVESVKGDKVFLIRNISLEEMFGKGVEESISFSTQHEAALVGVYVCTGTSETKSCRGKSTEDINEVFTEHLRGQLEGRTPSVSERNFFFQPVLVSTGVASVLGESPFREADKEKVKNYFKASGLGVSEIEGNLPKVFEDNDKVRSLSPRFDGASVVLSVPKADNSLCGG